MDEQREIQVELSEIDDSPATDVCQRPRAWRRLVEPAALVAAGVGAVLAVQHLTPAAESGPGRAAGGPAATGGQSAVHPGLILYSTGKVSEPVTVVAHRHSGGCGPSELTFDDVPIQQRHVRYFDALSPDWIGLLVTFDLPPTTTPGAHEVALVGPGPGCRERTRLAAATISVSR